MSDPGGKLAGDRRSDRVHGPTISIVVPTYEEHESIGDVLVDVDGVLRERACEIVLVDDSQLLTTVAEAVTVAGELQADMEIEHREAGSGLGSAVLDGIDLSSGEAIVVMDGDGQHPAAAVPELVDALEGADVAVGSRHAGDGRIRADWPLRRAVMSFGASAIAWAAVPDARRLQDPMSGFFAIRRSVVEPVADRLEPDGHKILLELLARCPIDSVTEVPIEFGERGAGESTTDAREMGRFLRHVSQLAVASRRRRRPERVTIPVEVDS